MTKNVHFIIMLSAACSGLYAQVSSVGMRVNLHPVQTIEISTEGFAGVTPRWSDDTHVWEDQLKINSTEGYRVVLQADGEEIKIFPAVQNIMKLPKHSALQQTKVNSQNSQLHNALIHSMTGAIDNVITVNYPIGTSISPALRNKKVTTGLDHHRVLVSIEPR